LQSALIKRGKRSNAPRSKGFPNSVKCEPDPRRKAKPAYFGCHLPRVVSIDLLVSTRILPISYGLAGIAADRFGVSLVFILGEAIAALVITLGLLHPAIRAVD